MATLNGIEFQILTIEWATHQNNVIQEVIGGDTVVVHSQGYKTDPVKIQGRVRNEKELDVFQEEFYSGGVLTFIKDVSSGRQYQIYALSNIKQEDSSNDKSQTGIVFNCLIQLAYPYMESSEITTRSKTITTQNQEWSADDDSNDIKTDGNVDAVPDIKVTGNVAEKLDIDQQVGVSNVNVTSVNNYGQTFTPIGINITKIVVKVDGVTTAGNITLTVWDSTAMNTNMGSKVVNITAVGETDFEFTTPIPLDVSQPYFRLTSSAANIDFVDSNANPYANGDQYKNDALQAGEDLWFKVYMTKLVTKSPSIYNTADSTVQCNMANTMLSDAIHRINVDGTGTIDYNDDFSTPKYQFDGTLLNVTYDTINDEIDIADDGYIYWKKDTKLPINGIPILTAKINITSGIPTIQISSDASTWYNIDTAIVDDIETVYPLDSDGNLSLAGETLFYFRIDCVKAAAATCSIKYFELDINIHTIYAKNPKITKGSSPSTFRIDQDSDSGMACMIDLIYRDKWWV